MRRPIIQRGNVAMIINRYIPLVVALLLVAIPRHTYPHREAPRVVREQRNVMADGVKEVWTLAGKGKPADHCMPEDTVKVGGVRWEGPFSCYCDVKYGAVGALGTLFLTRERNGVVVDQLKIPSIIDGSVKDFPPPVPMWPVYEADYDRYVRMPQQKLRREIMSRPKVQIMKLDDYNGDGWKTEFAMHVGGLTVCGWATYALIGISKDNPKLHLFGTEKHPEIPLELRWSASWHELLGIQPGQRKLVLQWPCGDHGNTVEQSLEFRIDKGKINADRLFLACSNTKEELGREEYGAR